MRPQAPGQRPPAPPVSNPQIGRVFPVAGEEGAPAGVVHSRQLFFFSDNTLPFANTAAVIAGAAASHFHLLSYNGTQAMVDAGTPLDVGASISLQGFAAAGSTTAAQVAWIAARFQVPEALIASGAITPGLWPWRTRAERMTDPYGDPQWTLIIERAYPPGTPGTEASRPTPIVGTLSAPGGSLVVLSAAIPSYQGNSLLTITSSRFYPGERGRQMLPARFGMNRAVMQLGDDYAGDTTVIVPWVPEGPR